MSPRWPQEGVPSPAQARALQEAWRQRVERANGFELLASLAGADISIRGGQARAALCVFAWPSLEPLAVATAVEPVLFPYVPGLLGFREVPALARAWERLPVRPDLVLVDGQGIAHPRRFGVATHLGLTLDVPTVGVAKSRLVGEHREPGQRRGARASLRHEGEEIGTVLRTRTGVAPLYVSIGHKVDLATAVRIVLASTRGFRLPEPIRAAHRAAGRLPELP